jgi:single-strand DNA-binding protein
MGITAVTVTGYVAIEPKLLFTRNSNIPVVHLRVATTPRRMDANGEWHDGQSSFFTVNCWRRLAMNVAASLHKGQPVLVRGKLKDRSWNQDGKTHTMVEIEADSIGHDMSFGWSQFVKGVPAGYAAMLDSMSTAGAGDALDGADGPGALGGDGGGFLADGDPFTGAGSPGGGGGLAGLDPDGGSGLAAGMGGERAAGVPDGELAVEGVPF